MATRYFEEILNLSLCRTKIDLSVDISNTLLAATLPLQLSGGTLLPATIGLTNLYIAI